MRAALAAKPLGYFDIPDDVVKTRIDSVTGAPVVEETPGSVQVLFKKGTEPTAPGRSS